MWDLPITADNVAQQTWYGSLLSNTRLGVHLSIVPGTRTELNKSTQLLQALIGHQRRIKTKSGTMLQQWRRVD